MYSNNENGFTLLETLIAMIILGISISILVEGYLIVTDSLEHQRNYNYAMTWSEQKMTEIINGAELARHGNFEHSDRLFYWNAEEKIYTGDSGDLDNNSGLKEIKLIVEWQGSNGSRYYRTSRVVLSDS